MNSFPGWTAPPLGFVSGLVAGLGLWKLNESQPVLRAVLGPAAFGCLCGCLVWVIDLLRKKR
jgi:hypothetical protein